MAQTVFLEFKRENGVLAAVGERTPFRIDGRWSADTTKERIAQEVARLRRRNSLYRKMLFVGYTYADARQASIRDQKDVNPPSWYLRAVNRRVESHGVKRFKEHMQDTYGFNNFREWHAASKEENTNQT